MATDQSNPMECQNIPLPNSRPGTPTDLFTNCERLNQVQSEIKKFTLLTIGARDSLNSLAPFMSIDDPEVTELFNRHKFYQEELHRSECEYGILPPCSTLGCTIHGTPPASPDKNLNEYPALPTTNSKNNSNKRKESDDGFISPSRRQTIKKPNLITNSNFTLEVANVFSNLPDQDIAGTSNSQTNTQENTSVDNSNQIKKFLPPPGHLLCTNTIRGTMKTINTAFPKLRSKLSCEFIKLYSDNSEQYRKLLHFVEENKFQFHSITPKQDRSIKVVIKGLPRDSNIEDIQEDLLEQGFHDCKVTQLIGRITKQKLPVFMVTLPRNINNTKIFDLKYLSYLSIHVEGYEGKGVTQCYSCNRFNHTAQNCHMNPRCIKCGQAHQTKECPIKRVENTYCINCKTYGHMANYSKCPPLPQAS
ncbi:nucleic-acid-binding protein from transposon X-element [Trichonephila clavipes]|nr:nucleic-acid-binding protein from transposon X-element [Trichonephila clavipes]